MQSVVVSDLACAPYTVVLLGRQIRGENSVSIELAAATRCEIGGVSGWDLEEAAGVSCAMNGFVKDVDEHGMLSAGHGVKRGSIDAVYNGIATVTRQCTPT